MKVVLAVLFVVVFVFAEAIVEFLAKGLPVWVTLICTFGAVIYVARRV
jgi:hypothetical protein